MEKESKVNVVLFDQAVELLSKEHELIKWPLTNTAEGNFIKNFGEEIGAFFISHSYRSGWRFGINTFDQVFHLHKVNFKKHNRDIYKQGYYIIGTGLHEDLIVLNLNTATVGYVSSEAFYRGEAEVDINVLFKDTGLDMGTFYYRSITEQDSFYRCAEDVR
ncbi:hypothetical protein [Myroides odoratimimus]|uniref:hypothetical protein n=1 Tax=Myroides odoratimimus TaxID=76832 RepID=UPI001CE1E017|nr:hypothetical protein [Myroides odoratimimus]MCA4806876.1 hypothetical protein [Myroides odoratimimus]MDM1530344.1 hypothetical protein [Myroides odoratimimus]